jgi:hypothetical protein
MLSVKMILKKLTVSCKTLCKLNHMFNTFSCIVFLAIMCLHLGLGRYHLNRICQATYDTMLSVLLDLSTVLIIYVYISFYTLFI